MSHITLHPTKGVNPYLTICPRCGADSGVALLGVRDYKTTCDSCGTVHFGGTNNSKCQKCGGTSLTREQLHELEKIPGILCHECEEKQKECDAAVKEGGIYWKCKDCHSEGSLKAHSEMSMHVRNHFGIKAPAPCGVEFSKEDCPVCGWRMSKDLLEPQAKERNTHPLGWTVGVEHEYLCLRDSTGWLLWQGKIADQPEIGWDWDSIAEEAEEHGRE